MASSQRQTTPFRWRMAINDAGLLGNPRKRQLDFCCSAEFCRLFFFKLIGQTSPIGTTYRPYTASKLRPPRRVNPDGQAVVGCVQATFNSRSKIRPGLDPKHRANALGAESHDTHPHAARRHAVRDEAIAIVGDAQSELGLVGRRTVPIRSSPGIAFALELFHALVTRSRCVRGPPVVLRRRPTEQFELDTLRASVRDGVVNGFLGDAIELESSGWTHPRALQICFESAADSKQLFCVCGELAQN